jgi:hypothetical protein
MSSPAFNGWAFRFLLNKRKTMSHQAAWILKENVVPGFRSAIPRTVNYIGLKAEIQRFGQRVN